MSLTDWILTGGFTLAALVLGFVAWALYYVYPRTEPKVVASSD
ncbi:hypothetical protein [Paenarthrobacter nicotinovorans]